MAIPRTLLIGIDGGSWNLLEPAIRRGWMPHFARFIAQARRGILDSVEPPVTIPAWHSMMTGMSPASMNRFGFASPGLAPGDFRLITSYRPFEAVWDTLGRFGWKVGVLNFPTIPAPAVNGFFVGGMVRGRDARTTFPVNLAGRLDREFGGWHYDLAEPAGIPRRKWLDIAGRSIDQKALATETLVAEYAPDFLFVLFSETDRVQHDMYDQLMPVGTEDAGPAASFWGALDAALQRVMIAFHPPGLLGYTFVLSDHGFGPTQGYFFTNRFLARRGYLRFARRPPARLRPIVADVLARLDRVLPLARIVRWGDRVRGRVAGADGDRGSALDQTFSWYARFVDWNSTRAYSAPVPEAIYANSQGGRLSEEERQRLKAELTRDLREFAGAAIQAIDPEEIYHRPLPSGGPLLLLSVNEHAWETRGDLNHTVEHLDHRPSYFQRAGAHRREGILAVAGPGVAPGYLPEPVPLLDIAPTLFALLGLRPSPQHEGVPNATLLPTPRTVGSAASTRSLSSP